VRATRCSAWLAPPRIVAEALRELEDPLASLLDLPPPAPAQAVARGIVAGLVATEDAMAPSRWLLPSQHRSFRRLVAALERFGGALLADPVGSGKTYVALAVVAALAPRAAVAIVPAALLDQWRRTALHLGVALQLHSHEKCSRGLLPGPERSLVVVDESHRFRNAASRRYKHLAPWLMGRKLLLVSATPVVNRLDDLAAQLLLGVRDDALRVSGIPSLRTLLARGQGHPALGELIVAATAQDGFGPARREARIQAPEVPWPVIEAIDRLAHSAREPVAALLRGVAWQAAASSPAALLGVLRRYRALLLQARDAANQGRALSRTALRQFTGDLGEQLVLWAMLEPLREQLPAACDLPLGDIDRIAAVMPEVRRWAESGDAKLGLLAARLADGRRSLVFTTARETVRHLRNGLPGPVAWCTGDSAGLGPSRLPRDTVLGWFGTARRWIGPGAPPAVLLSTDVSAEGLDLQSAGRVIHYDLPWTPVRLLQREGRALRRGACHDAVEILRFEPPPDVEERIRKSWHLARKGGLPARIGLGSAGRPLWNWRDALAATLGEGGAVEGVAAVEAAGHGAGVLAGFTLAAVVAGTTQRLTGQIVWLPCEGPPSQDPDLLERLLTAAMAAPAAVPPGRDALEEAVAGLAPLLRERLAGACSDRWRSARATPEARTLAGRLHHLLRQARRRRDQAALAAIDRGLAFAARGHTAGETMLAGHLALVPERAMLERLSQLPRDREEQFPLLPRLTGVIVFRS
jgi:hypothetical protein